MPKRVLIFSCQDIAVVDAGVPRGGAAAIEAKVGGGAGASEDHLDGGEDARPDVTMQAEGLAFGAAKPPRPPLGLALHDRIVEGPRFSENEEKNRRGCTQGPPRREASSPVGVVRSKYPPREYAYMSVCGLERPWRAEGAEHEVEEEHQRVAVVV